MSNPPSVTRTMDPWIVFEGREPSSALWEIGDNAKPGRFVLQRLTDALAELALIAPAGLYMPIACLADLARDPAAALSRLTPRSRAGYLARELRRLSFSPLEGSTDGLRTYPHVSDFRARLLALAKVLEALPRPAELEAEDARRPAEQTCLEHGSPTCLRCPVRPTAPEGKVHGPTAAWTDTRGWDLPGRKA